MPPQTPAPPPVAPPDSTPPTPPPQAQPPQPAQVQQSPQPKKNITKYLLLATAFLPLVGWGIGALGNPTGWMSDTPFMAYVFVIFLVSEEFLPFTLIILAVVGVGLFHKSSRFATAVILCGISFMYSLFVLQTTLTADEDEFTG